MCTITLSYDGDNKVAVEKLATLLSSGFFVQVDKQEGRNMNYADESLYEIESLMPDIDRDVTPEEMRSVLISDLNFFYGVK